MTRGRPLAALIACGALAAGVFGACGSSDSQSEVRILDTEKVERAIASSSLEQRGVEPEVSCPADIPQQEGLRFTCTAKVGEDSTTFVVVQRDDAGNVHYRAP